MNNYIKRRAVLQPVPEKTRIDIVIGTEIKIPNGQNSCLFSNEPFEKKPVMTIEDFGFHSADHFESYLSGNRLYTHIDHKSLLNGSFENRHEF